MGKSALVLGATGVSWAGSRYASFARARVTMR